MSSLPLLLLALTGCGSEVDKCVDTAMRAYQTSHPTEVFRHIEQTPAHRLLSKCPQAKADLDCFGPASKSKEIDEMTPLQKADKDWDCIVESKRSRDHASACGLRVKVGYALGLGYPEYTSFGFRLYKLWPGLPVFMRELCEEAYLEASLENTVPESLRLEEDNTLLDDCAKLATEAFEIGVKAASGTRAKYEADARLRCLEAAGK